MKLRYLLILISILALGVFSSSTVQAGGDVTVCDEANFLAALSGGGLVTFSCSGTISLTGALTISEDTVIDGTGQSVSFVPSGNHQIFNTAANISFRNVTIANGYGGPYTSGAGIGNTGTLLLDRVTVANNGAGTGAGIINYGQLTIHESTIRDNISLASGNGIGGTGAGLFNSGDVLIDSSTFYGNYANTGGAIYNLDGTIDIVNSTFYENDALPDAGGAIYNSLDGTVNVINSTFDRNQAGQYSDGSAIDNTDGGTLTLTNSIVANSLSGDSCAGSVTDGGGNLSFPDDSCPGLNLDPVLGSLGNNGGPTLTVALMDGSSAVDNADDAVCAASPVNGVDQRGVARPVGNGCDIGAFESMASPPAPDFVMQVDPAYTALCLGGSLDFDVGLLSVMGFDEDVNLSVLNLPDGAEYSFDNNPVAPPFTSTLTINDDSILEPDWYTFDVVGASITRTHSYSVALYLYDVPAQSQANLLSPADGAVDVDWHPNFAWDPVPGATYYDIEVATDVNFNNIVYTYTSTVLNHTPYPTFQTGTEHFWRVSTRNYCGDGVVSEVHSFTTVGDTIPPTWYWDAERTWVYTCPEVDAMYDLTLYGITGFSDDVTLSTDRLPPGATSSFSVNPVIPTGKTILTISDLQADEATEYAIEVIGTSDTQTKSYFLELNLKPGIPDEAPNMQSPLDGETEVGGNPTFAWEEVPGAQWYYLEVAMDSDFNNIIYHTEVLQNSHVKPTPLMGDTEYYWRVTPINACGTGPTSVVYNFFTGESTPPPPPPPPDPVDNVIYLPMVMGMEN